MSSKAQSKEKFKSKIGGQAVIEGVMMRGIDKAAMACRLPDGTIDLEEWAIKGGKDTPWYRKTPFVRGIFSFLTSLIDGYKCLTRSAEKQMTEDDEEEQTKFEQWLDDKLGDKLGPIITAISMVLGVGLAILLFMYLPSVVSKFISKFVHLSAFGKNIIEGILKIAIFIGYTALTALTKDIRRTYEYHGAEHKTIACYEHEEELTVENVKKYTRFHPRCGTSFIFITLIVSILVMCCVPLTVVWQRVLVSILLLPLVVGISYEFIRIAGRSDSWITRALSFPGLQIQRITTREPDASQIECAIAALKPCIPDNLEEDEW